MFNEGFCIFASLWRSTVFSGPDIILKDIESNMQNKIAKNRQEHVRQDTKPVPLN